MAGADSAALSGLEKDVFEKGVSEGVNNSFPLKDVFKTEQVDYLGGGGHIWSHHYGRNPSPMYVAEDSAFAAAGAQRHAKGRIQVTKGMARLRITREAMDDYVSSEASFKNGFTDEKTRLVDDISKRQEFALSSDGRGIFCLVNGTLSSSTALVVDAPGNIAGADFGNRFLQVGMVLAAINPATGAIRTGTPSVTAVSAAGTGATLSAAVSWTDNDYVVQAANTSVTDTLDTSYNKAPVGLPGLIDDSTNLDNYFGILRSNVSSLKSYVLGSTGAMSLDLFQRTADVVNQKLGGEIDMILAHHSVRREYIKLTNSDRRYAGADLQKPDGGTVAMKQGDMVVGGIIFRAIRSIGLAQVYFLDTKGSGFKRYVAEPGKFEEQDGSIWIRDGVGNSARHAFEAWYYWRDQYFARDPGRNARWDAVTGQTLVVVRDE